MKVRLGEQRLGWVAPVVAAALFMCSCVAQALERNPNIMDMKIYRVGSQSSVSGPQEYFTGNVRIDPLFDPTVPARTSAAIVTFEPGARSAWHTHPLGQHLIVLSGCGWTQCWGGPKKTICAGDVVFCNCGKKHWHGATDTTGMSHIAVQEWLDGTPVNWLEKVSDEQYMSAVEPD